MVFKRRTKPPFLSRVREFFLPRRGWRRALAYLGHRVKRIPDTPHRIALGFACGAFASFSPLFGLHFFYAAGLAWLLRGNIVASLIGTVVGNPITFPFIASSSLALGRRILGYGATGRDFSRVTDAFGQAFQALWQNFLSIFGLYEAEWGRLYVFFTDILLPYYVGGLLPGLIASIACYYVIRPLASAYQARRRAKMIERAKARVLERAEAERRAAETHERP